MHSINDAVDETGPLDVAIANGGIRVKCGEIDCLMTPMAALEMAHRIILAANQIRSASA